MTALTVDELMAWVENMSSGWRGLLTEYPEALQFPCDIRESSVVGDVVHHIVAVELRYAQRLSGLKESTYDEVPRGPAATLYATHDQAMAVLRDLLSKADVDWEGVLEFSTRSAGTFRATRRTILVHLLMHSIRHYAQLATVVRQNGVKPDWGMDYLMMGIK